MINSVRNLEEVALIIIICLLKIAFIYIHIRHGYWLWGSNKSNMDKNEETKPPDNIIYNKNDSSVSSFISHLITAFNCRGIKLFSGICLVIFSRDYASSVSCLENLAKHLELSFCDKKSYEVVPVFYGVSRSDVRQQSGPFSDAFTELERSYPADKVTRLRWALAKIAELKGHEYDEEFWYVNTTTLLKFLLTPNLTFA